MTKPHYSTTNYKAFCRQQKAKGLLKRYWKDLPKLWKKELAWRREFENALKDLTFCLD